MSKQQYFESVGRRKTAVARVRISKSSDGVVINGKPLDQFFTIPRLRTAVTHPIAQTGFDKTFSISAHVLGGGINAQAEAIRHGVARALLAFDEGLRGQLRSFGYLTRDARAVERKKYGLKKARRSPSWSKR